jgi:hypothetical protein
MSIETHQILLKRKMFRTKVVKKIEEQIVRAFSALQSVIAVFYLCRNFRRRIRNVGLACRWLHRSVYIAILSNLVKVFGAFWSPERACAVKS